MNPTLEEGYEKYFSEKSYRYFWFNHYLDDCSEHDV